VSSRRIEGVETGLVDLVEHGLDAPLDGELTRRTTANERTG
jgi:hypothetical protein